MDATIAGAYIGAAGAIAGSVYAAVSGRRANKRMKDADDRAKALRVEAEAFERARRIYDDAIERLERQLAYVTSQVDRLGERLSEEQGVSDGLRRQVRDLQDHLGQQRDDPLEELRRHQTPPPEWPIRSKGNGAK